jgi:hypothetical protein
MVRFAIDRPLGVVRARTTRRDDTPDQGGGARVGLSNNLRRPEYQGSVDASSFCTVVEGVSAQIVPRTRNGR